MQAWGWCCVPNCLGAPCPFSANGTGSRRLFTATSAGFLSLFTCQFLSGAAPDRCAFPKGWAEVIGNKRIRSLLSADPAYWLCQKFCNVAEPSTQPIPMEIASGGKYIEPVKYKVAASNSCRIFDLRMMKPMYQ